MLYAVMILAWDDRGYGKSIVRAFSLQDAERLATIINREFDARSESGEDNPRRQARIVTRVTGPSLSAWVEVNELAYVADEIEKLRKKHEANEALTRLPSRGM